jgi:hypothetical protein
MIECICDGCGARVPYKSPELPEGWAVIMVEVSWSKGIGEKRCSEEWESDDGLLVCGRCRGEAGNKLLEIAEDGVREAIDHRPKAVPR